MPKQMPLSSKEQPPTKRNRQEKPKNDADFTAEMEKQKEIVPTPKRDFSHVTGESSEQNDQSVNEDLTMDKQKEIVPTPKRDFSHVSGGSSKQKDQSVNEDFASCVADIKDTTKRFRGKVTKKSPVTPIGTPNKKGSKISAIFADESGAIKVTGLYEASKSMDKNVHLDKTYEIQNFRVSPTNKVYNSTNHNFEILTTRNTVFSPIDDVIIPVENLENKFLTWQEAQETADLQYFNMKGNIVQIYERKSVHSPAKKADFFVQLIELKDINNEKFDVKLWGQDTNILQEDSNENEEMRVFNCKVDRTREPHSINASNAKVTIGDRIIIDNL